MAAVIGPSGGGKSTLLRCINGLEPFQAGEVRVGDVALHPDDVRAADAATTLLALRRRVGMVFQQFNLFPHMTVLENVMIGPRLCARSSRATQAEPVAQQLLERVGLGEKLHAQPGATVRRPAAARRDRPGPGGEAGGDPVRRADQRPRPADGGRGAGRHRRPGPTAGQTMIVVTHAMGFARQVATHGPRDARRPRRRVRPAGAGLRGARART